MRGTTRSMTANNRRTLVTGATGFLGCHLVPALVKSGHDIAGTIEPGAPVTTAGLQMFPADISTGEGLAAAFAGAGVVIHLAARNHLLKETAKDPLAEYRRVNVEGTRKVARAAAENGARLFIHISSVKAMGDETGDAPLEEDSPCRPGTPYGISKLESEEAAGSELSGSGTALVILRIPMVYGPGNKGNLPRMIRWANRGLPFPLFHPDNLRSMVYVGNVVHAVILAIQKATPGVSTFILKDLEDYSTRRLYAAICRELGKTPLFLPFPAWMAHFGGVISRDFRKVTSSFRVSSLKIEKELGFSPPFTLNQGIAETVRWYRCLVR